MARVYLRLGDDDISYALQHPSVKQATAAYERVAVPLAKYGRQRIGASLYFPKPGDIIDEKYPDIVLSLDENLNVISVGA